MFTESELCLALIDDSNDPYDGPALSLVRHEDIAKLPLVRSAATVDANGEPVPGGLFCREIFGDGPAISNASNDDGPEPYMHPRANTWGRIDLALPMIHPLALTNMYEDLLERTQIPRDELRPILIRPTHEGRARLRATHELDNVRPLLIRSMLVIPPYMRDGTRHGTDDLGELYRQLVALNARLLEKGSAERITGEEDLELFYAVDNVLNNIDDRARGDDRHTLASLNMMWQPKPLATLAAFRRGEPLTRKTQIKLACVRAFGVEVPGLSSTPSTLGVPL